VPAFVISPLVDPATVHPQPLDHTSVLQLLADKFARGFYSPEVYNRQPSLSRLSDAITRTVPRSRPPNLLPWKPSQSRPRWRHNGQPARAPMRPRSA
jgi:phospholipase C